RQQPERKEKHRNGQRRANHEQQRQFSKLSATHDVQHQRTLCPSLTPMHSTSSTVIARRDLYGVMSKTLALEFLVGCGGDKGFLGLGRAFPHSCFLLIAGSAPAPLLAAELVRLNADAMLPPAISRADEPRADHVDQRTLLPRATVPTTRTCLGSVGLPHLHRGSI